MSLNYFPVLLLFLALQASHGRNLGDVGKRIQVDKLQVSNQTEKNASTDERLRQARTINPEVGIPAPDEKKQGARLGDGNSKVFHMTPSADSVFWRLPRKKHHFENPVFSFDYESPKTHPSTHN